MSKNRFDRRARKGCDLRLPLRPPLHYGRPMKPAAMVLALAVTAALPATAAAQLTPPASPSGDVPGQVIVQFKAGVSASARGTVRGAADVDVVRAMRKDGQQLLEVQAGQTVAAAIRELEADPRVSYAQPNHIYRATAVPNDSLFGQLWGQRNTGQAVYGLPGVAGVAGADTDATLAWNRTTGSRSILVAVTDTGIAYDHPDLAANMWSNPADPPGGGDNDGNGIVDDVHGADFCPEATPVSACDSTRDGDPRDLNMHGTHVAGTIGAVGNDGLGVPGMNWQVTLMAVRVLNADGFGTSAAIAEGFDYAGDHGARVVNASLGGSGFDDPAERGAIHDHPNTLYVVAAGNDGVDNDGGNPHVPCNLDEPNLVCVAATTQTDQLAGFSNFGTTSVDLGAPGTNILSTVPSYNGFQDGFEADNLNVNWVAQAPWGRVNGTSGSGSFSVADSPAGSYAPNVDASIRTATAVPLTGNTCRVSYDLRLESERIGDFFIDGVIIESSPNATTWTERGLLSGSTGGQFLAISTDLPGGTPLYVRFRFQSDATVEMDGAYLDNVRIGCIDTAYAGTEYGFLDGTSMATPQVTGAAALALSLKDVSTADLKSALMSSGDAIAALNGKTATGRRLNVVNLLNTISPPPAAPAPTNPPSGGGATPPVKTLSSVRVDRCKQSGRGRTLQLKCRLRDSDALVSSTAKIKKGRRTVATGKAKLAKGTLSIKLKRKLRKGRYTLTLSLRGAASAKRTLNVKFKI
jgi:subtilisin family serine protease